jgi:hypothetical protein
MNTILIGIVALLVAAGGGYYAFSHHSSVSLPTSGIATSTDTNAQPSQSAQDAAPGKFTGSYAALAARSGSWKCTVDSAAMQTKTSGVAYVSSGKLHADFTTSVPSYGSMESHVIADGTDVYTWSSIMPQGIKTKMVQGQGSGSGATSGQGSDANQSYSYDCQPWTADASLFVPPSTVTFKAY